ncbi:MAG TPA: hypothetical protein VGD34_24350, partial [Kribbella sp.]
AGVEENVYSFDGNSGGTGAIAELLVQSTGTEIELLPALPTSWPDGSVRGLRARGGYTVDVSWRAGRLDRAVITSPSTTATDLRVRLGDDVIELTAAPGATIEVRPAGPHPRTP